MTTDGIWLGKWLYECRRAYRGESNNTVKVLTQEQIRELESLGMDWRTPAERAWEEKYQAAAEMLEKMRQASIADDSRGTEKRTTFSSEYPPSHSIRQWLVRQRSLFRQGKLSNEQITRLNALNVIRQAR